ncbi:helix-turn-helix transcriptional regulator [Stenotrophomonas lacuserhaii]|uniref:helix-turn-helix transcriptional regulator n=1 Tax=Stenotrophomonas lacuserhaii TaxID=2760084 RepID=UPI0015FCFBDD|nr:hypothetical protein [Stenotrophomonas lacuserhaii]
MQCRKKTKPDFLNERELNKGEATSIRVQTNTDERDGDSDDLLLRFPELLKLTKVGRSKAYDLMNPKSPAFDPDYPAGFPLFDSPRSPKVYWRHEALAWIEGRSNKFRNQQQRNQQQRNQQQGYKK